LAHPSQRMSVNFPFGHSVTRSVTASVNRSAADSLTVLRNFISQTRYSVCLDGVKAPALLH
ncbi:hypothetical protein N9H90_11155, partial [Pseudomonadales bacterium]|nr:hypothetical protein [Pseudomonadales bacterium]